MDELMCSIDADSGYIVCDVAVKTYKTSKIIKIIPRLDLIEPITITFANVDAIKLAKELL